MNELSIVATPSELDLETTSQELIVSVKPVALLLSTSEPPCVVDLTVITQPLVIKSEVSELIISSTQQVLEIGELCPVGGGEENTGLNVGGEAEVFRDKTGIALNFRTIEGVGDIAAAVVGDVIQISAGDIFPADCLLADVPGNCVYFTGPVSGGFRQVTTIDPLIDPPQIFVGLILAKSTDTRCTVQRSGRYAVPYAIGFDDVLFVALDGRLSGTPPPAGPGELAAWQAIATGVDTDVVLLQPHWSLFQIRG